MKICGTTNLADAELAVELGADALGFIFAPSKRRVTVEQAGEIARLLPAHVERVGVFTAPDVEEIRRAVQGAGLSAVQMHWTYNAGEVAELREALGAGIKLWQVVGFEMSPADEEQAERAFTQTLGAAMLDSRLSVVLLDTVKAGASGGMGETFSWGRAGSLLKTARVAQERAAQASGEALPKIILAGGLRADNLREAVAAIRPAGVDVVSGVEESPGKKSSERMKGFLEAAREAEAVLPSLATPVKMTSPTEH